MAVGSKCGRVSIYLASSMALLHVVALCSFSHQHSIDKRGKDHFRTGPVKRVGDHSEGGTKAANQSIKAVKFLDNGSFLLVLRADDAVFVLPTSGAIMADGTPNSAVFSHQPRPVPLYLKASTTGYAIYPIYGDDALYSVVRRHTVFVYAIERRDDGAFHSVRIGSMKLSASRFFDGDLTAPITREQTGGLTSRAYVAAATRTYPIRIRTLHVIKECSSKSAESPRLRLAVVGSLSQMGFESSLGFLFAGSAEMSDVCGALERNPHHEVNLFTCSSLGVLGHSYAQNRQLLAAACGDAVCAFDVARLHTILSKVRANALAVAEEEYAAAEHDDTSDEVSWRRAVGTKGSIVRAVFNNKELVAECCRGLFFVNTDTYGINGAAAARASIALEQGPFTTEAQRDLQPLYVCTDAAPSPSVYQVLV